MRSRRLAVVMLISLAIAIALVVFPNDQPNVANPDSKASLPVNATSTTSTTIVPAGKLPQTKVFPSASDPVFVARIRDLVAAAAANRSTIAEPAFFPIDAYIQVKDIVNPVADWRLRLLVNYDSDIGLVHNQLGQNAAAAKFLSVTVPSGATWVAPGAELNKGSYWRVFGTVVYCKVGSEVEHFIISSMISWRGEWYVVHLGVIR